MRKYYYKKQGESYGPFTLNQLYQERISWDTMIRFEGMLEWQPAKNIRELTPVIKAQLPFRSPAPKNTDLRDSLVVIGVILYFAYSFGAFIVELIKGIFKPQ